MSLIQDQGTQQDHKQVDDETASDTKGSKMSWQVVQEQLDWQRQIETHRLAILRASQIEGAKLNEELTEAFRRIANQLEAQDKGTKALVQEEVAQVKAEANQKLAAKDAELLAAQRELETLRQLIASQRCAECNKELEGAHTAA